MKHFTPIRLLGALTVGLLVAGTIAAPSAAVTHRGLTSGPLSSAAVSLNKTGTCTSAEGNKATIYLGGKSNQFHFSYKIEKSKGVHPIYITDAGVAPARTSVVDAAHNGKQGPWSAATYKRGSGTVTFKVTFGKNWLGVTRYCTVSWHF